MLLYNWNKEKEVTKMKTTYEALKTMTEDEFVENELKKQEEISRTTNPLLFELLHETEGELRNYYRSHKH